MPKSRNNREDNAKLKAGELPEGWDKDNLATVHMRSQKDTDARRTKKNQETHFGYKNPINADAQKQKASSRQKSESRSGVEHVFGAQAQMGGHVVRTIDIARARVKIAMMNWACNMRRFVLLCRGESRAWRGDDGRVRPLWPEGH